ncbi:hypothetical protein Slin15195_G122140 [Septoria linicola]|uniref:Uncharacterized protein n=1 Tax=Septoria linicola TaxID=215465 RepID=A0A9Q9B1F3_9PEZI|nr:hypothetical protein Slin14017_G078350 [Septoria linicola]USW58895.1 hypothetical protein Slin15195_G122140 [Septoria linicola]
MIRNPVFAVPSNYKGFSQTLTIRPGDEDWDLITGMQIQRYLFDFFRKRDGRAPLVIDGDDVVWRTAEVGSKEWEAVPEGQRSSDALLGHFLQDINDSTGIVRSTDAPRDAGLDSLYLAWVASFGEQVATLLRVKVEENMPHSL